MQQYERYKDSGISWLGEIPEHWAMLKGQFIFDIINNKTAIGTEELLSVSERHGVKKRSESNVNMFLAANYEGYKLCQKGDLVINSLWAWSRGLGFSEYEGIISTAYSVYRPKVNLDYRYMHYLLRTEKYVAQYLIASKGIWISRLQLSDWAFLRIPILFPPLHEQEAIAAHLDEKCEKIDAIVSIKEQQIEKLKELRQITIHNAVTKGINSNTEMKDSSIDWIGEIPSHWEVKANRAIFRERNEKGNEGLPLLSVSIHSAVSTDEVAEDLNIRGRIKIEDKSSYKLVKCDDIVFNMMRAWQGAIGRVLNEGMVSPAYIVAEPIVKIDSLFIEYQFRTTGYIEYMNRVSKGITDFRKRLYWDQFKGLNMVIPPISEQQEIVDYLEEQTAKIDKAISQKQEQITKLKEYKQSLINEVVTGKVKITDKQLMATDK